MLTVAVKIPHHAPSCSMTDHWYRRALLVSNRKDVERERIADTPIVAEWYDPLRLVE